jgi:hypothetical protein
MELPFRAAKINRQVPPPPILARSPALRQRLLAQSTMGSGGAGDLLIAPPRHCLRRAACYGPARGGIRPAGCGNACSYRALFSSSRGDK